MSKWRAMLALVLLALAVGACKAGAPSAVTTASPPTPAPTPFVIAPIELKTYRYTVALAVAEVPPVNTAPSAPEGAGFTIAISGAVVNPDREQLQTHAKLGAFELALERIEIGNKAWTRESGGDWKRATPGGAPAMLGGDVDISPASIFAPDSTALAAISQQLANAPFSEDTVAGAKARRYDLDAQQFRAIFGAAGVFAGDSQSRETKASIWIGNGPHVPVRLHVDSTSASGTPAVQMDMTLSDVNADVTIAPPTS